jgi:hypothetical protein
MLQLFEGEGGAIDPARAPQLSFVPTPGHTPGHIAVCVTPVGEAAPRAVYVGDALHVRCAHTARAACAACAACALVRCLRCVHRTQRIAHRIERRTPLVACTQHTPCRHTLRAGQNPAQVERPEWSPHFDCCRWAGKLVTAGWTAGMRRSAAEGGSWRATTSAEQVTLALALSASVPSV